MTHMHTTKARGRGSEGRIGTSRTGPDPTPHASRPSPDLTTQPEPGPHDPIPTAPLAAQRSATWKAGPRGPAFGSGCRRMRS